MNARCFFVTFAVILSYSQLAIGVSKLSFFINWICTRPFQSLSFLDLSRCTLEKDEIRPELSDAKNDVKESLDETNNDINGDLTANGVSDNNVKIDGSSSAGGGSATIGGNRPDTITGYVDTLKQAVAILDTLVGQIAIPIVVDSSNSATASASAPDPIKSLHPKGLKLLQQHHNAITTSNTDDSVKPNEK